MVLPLSQKALTPTTVYTHGMMSSLIFFLGPSCLKCCKSTHCYTSPLCKLRLFALNRSHVVPFLLLKIIYKFGVYRQHWTLFRQGKYRREKRKGKKRIKFNSSPCPWRCGCLSAWSSVCNSPLLDTGVVGGGDQSVSIYPSQAANVVQSVSVCNKDITAI